MSYAARVFRILIASPSDVDEERNVAVKVIQEWNDLNSSERQVVLLPLRWETHSAPEYGKRPQEVINRQVVDKCDLLLGIFWTRIGSPTGEADSGTLEEIERVAKSGKLVMLYFSKAKQDPDAIELEQIAKLREFKTKTFPKGLVERYSSIIEFRDKIAKQLEIQIRALLSEQNASGEDVVNRSSTTDIHIEAADAESGARAGKVLDMKTELLTIVDFETTPDYGDLSATNPDDNLLTRLSHSTPNKDYYREFFTFLVQKNMFKPFRIWLKNEGGIGARDVYVDIQLKAKSGTFIALPVHSFPTGSPSKTIGYLLAGGASFLKSPSDLLAKAADSWQTSFEIKALQPKREVSPQPLFFIGSEQDAEIEVTTRTYADTLPEPYTETILIKLHVSSSSVKAKQLLDALLKTPAL